MGKIGKIKIFIIIISALLNLFIPTKGQEMGLVISTLVPILFGSLSVPFLFKFFWNREITSPNWDDNPLNSKKPLSRTQFGSYLLISTGISLLIGVGIKYKTLSDFGLASVSYGLGLYIGMWLTLQQKKCGEQKDLRG